MKHRSTTFARVVVYLVGMAAFAVCGILLPELIREESVGKPDNAFLPYLTLSIAYILALPFFIALYQTHTLLNHIDCNNAFSKESIKALKNIKRCALAFSLLVIIAAVGAISFARSVNPSEDVTFIITLGFIFSFASGIIAVFVAVLQKLLTDAVLLKSENDLIV